MTLFSLDKEMEYLFEAFIVASIIAGIIVYLMRRKNISFPRLGTKQITPRQQKTQNNGNPSKSLPIHHLYLPEEDNVNHAQSIARFQMPKTTKTSRGQSHKFKD